MNENEFILKLQRRASEQERMLRDMPFSKAFGAVSLWLGHHPYRILIPLAFLMSLLFRALFGGTYTDFVLNIFRTI